MPVSVQQQILRLEIAVDDVHAVEVIQGQGDFGGVELRNGVGEALLNLVSTENAKLPIERQWLTCDFRSKLNSSPPSMKSMTMYRFLES